MSQVRRPTVSRSDTVRNRRNQQSAKRIQQAGLQAHHPPAVPRIMVRGGSPVMDKQKFNPPRRRYSINMGTSGAELQMPAMPVVQPGWRLLSGLIAVVACLLFVILTSTAEFDINNIELNGIQRIDPNTIDQYLRLKGSSIFEFVPAEAIQSMQEDFPELFNVRVNAMLPGTVSITAEERQPILAWNTGETILWIDASGYAFPARGDAGPLLTINSTNEPPYFQPQPLSGDGQQAIPNTLNHLRDTAKASTWPKQIPGDLLKAAYELRNTLTPEVVLNYDPVSGLGWDDPAGWKVFIGSSLEDLDIKLAMYQTIIENLSAQGIHPALISVESIHAPYYRLEI